MVPVRHWRAAWPWPQHGDRDLPGEKPTTRLEKLMLNLLYRARGEVLVGSANDAKKTYFRTKERGKLSICEFSRCG